MSSGTMAARGGMTCGESTYLAEEWNYASLLMVSFTGHSALCVFLKRCKGRKIPHFFAMHGWMERCLESLAQSEQCQASLEKKGLYLCINTVKGSGWMQMSPVPCLSPLKQGGQDQDH